MRSYKKSFPELNVVQNLEERGFKKCEVRKFNVSTAYGFCTTEKEPNVDIFFHLRQGNTPEAGKSPVLTNPTKEMMEVQLHGFPVTSVDGRDMIRPPVLPRAGDTLYGYVGFDNKTQKKQLESWCFGLHLAELQDSYNMRSKQRNEELHTLTTFYVCVETKIPDGTYADNALKCMLQKFKTSRQAVFEGNDTTHLREVVRTSFRNMNHDVQKLLFFALNKMTNQWDQIASPFPETENFLQKAMRAQPAPRKTA